MYDKWFMQAIPPSNTKVGLPLSDATKNAWNNPNDKPMEEYATAVTRSSTRIGESNKARRACGSPRRAFLSR